MATAPQDYIRHKLPLTGGLNVDAASLVGDDDFVELHNLRKSHADGYELRSGHATYLSSYKGYPQFKCEFVVFDDDNNLRYKYDATVYNRLVSPGVYEVRVQLLDKELRSISDDILVAGTFTTEQTVVCGQSQFALLVSIFGFNTFLVYPTTLLPRPGTWTVKQLLPEASSAPFDYTFVTETEGDLILQDHDNDSGSPGTDGAGFRTTKLIPPLPVAREFYPRVLLAEADRFVNGNKYVLNRLPIKCPYYLREASPDLFPGCPIARWVTPPEDTNPVAPYNVKNATAKLQTQGWIYRVVYVYRFTDANANNYEYRAQASPDFWVKDSIYSPPQLFKVDNTTGDVLGRPDGLRGITGPLFPNEAIRSYYDGYDDVNGGDQNIRDTNETIDGTAKPYPSVAAMRKLLKRFVEYYAVDKDPDVYTEAAASGASPFWDNTATGGNWPNGGILAYYAAWWMGFRNMTESGGANPPRNLMFFGKEPWWCEVPASYLKGAPMTKFAWNDFPQPEGLVGIEFYRTAYNCPLSQDNAKWSPDFGEHSFGFVGSLSKVEGSNDNNFFIDDIPDTGIDFGKNPEDYDGYIADQLTAQVYTEYNSQGVFGNLKTKNWTLDPAPLVPNGRAVFYNPIDGAAGIDHNAYGGFWTIALQYVDIDGYKSRAQLSRIDWTAFLQTSDWHIAITMPTGYAPSVVRVNVYYVKYATLQDMINAGMDTNGDIVTGHNVQAVRFIESVNVSKRYYFIRSSTGWETVSTDALLRQVNTTVQPGAIIKSKAFNPFQWDPINTEIMHHNKPITIMEVIAGRLWVLTDGSIHLTEANGQRQEPENNRIGCIGRYCGVKVDKVVYFLSGDGLYYTEASGPVKLPIKIQNLILPYLQEVKQNELPLHNASRAAMGYDGQRNELWLHIPASGANAVGALAQRASSGYLGTPLPHRTIIIRLNESYMPQNANVYTFDLAAKTTQLDSYALGETDRILPAIFSSHSDGTIWTSYGPLAGSIKELTMITLNADDPSQVWNGESILSKAVILRDPQAVKVLRKVDVTFQAKASFDITTGVGSTTGGWTPLDGFLSDLTTRYNFTIDDASGGGYKTRSHEPPGSNINSVGKILYIRLKSKPSPAGYHEVKYKDIAVYIAARHVHV